MMIIKRGTQNIILLLHIAFVTVEKKDGQSRYNLKVKNGVLHFFVVAVVAVAVNLLFSLMEDHKETIWFSMN